MNQQFNIPKDLLPLLIQLQKEKYKTEEARLQQKIIDAFIAEQNRKAKELKFQQKEIDAFITVQNHQAEEARHKTEEIKLERQKEETKRLELEREKREHVEENDAQKRLKSQDEQQTSTSSQNHSSALDNASYYNSIVKKDLYRFDIESLLNDNDNINDDMINIFEECFYSSVLDRIILENNMQVVLEDSIHKLFDKNDKFKNLSSLKYLNTTHHKYLMQNTSPDCTFTYKNININIRDEYGSLQDFVVCLGEVKSSNESIDAFKHIGQLCSYLTDVLKIQNRQKIYGFITNLQHIRFYYVVKERNSSSCNYNFYQSDKLEMFYMPSKSTSSSSSSSAVNKQISNEQLRRRHLNNDTMKILIKFLTMNAGFYEYNMLNINPGDNLFGDQYYIRTRLGCGLTSMVYLLVHNNYNESLSDRQSRVMKICKSEDYCDMFMNEINIFLELKNLNDTNNLKLFFSNIEEASLEGKFILFENFLKPLESIKVPQAEQLISIIEYLHKCRIIHRDIRPENLMVNKTCNHLKLIDFGFATTLEDNENTIELEIAGVVSFGGLQFLKSYLQELTATTDYINYNYERTFDLQCALNVVMYMKDYKIANEFKLLKHLPLLERVAGFYKFWLNLKQNNEYYNDLINLIENVSNSSDFEPVKRRIKILF
ncbi:unnamed protein product [Rotaria magnacalcarata]|uniref:Protein kinase domain-containing protein n=3 Tax=Rotaria magnacalcarata TaxID=392030 RepID=A0A816UIA6_9BILA|nr:unnamed protein product [Rotaria magnacalcarata]